MTQVKFLLMYVCILATQTRKSDQCMRSLKSIAVYEGQPNTVINLANDSQDIRWSVVSTANESRSYNISNFGGYINPSLTGLYDVNQTALLIKNATISGNPLSTAGMYIGVFADDRPNFVGVKLLVVRSGPQCSCISINSTASNVSCSVTYADSSSYPIQPIVTWKLNGTYLANYTLQRERLDPYVYYAESTIATNSGSPESYECELTFADPSVVSSSDMWPTRRPPVYAPEFNESCSISGCGETTEPLTLPPTTTAEPSTTECNCIPSTACPTTDRSCTKTSECRSDGTNLRSLYDECVVKAELYARCDNCCPENLVCGVVVTIRNDSRWLIHDPICDDNKCDLVVVDASCMSSNWKLLSDRKIMISGVGDYMQVGNSVQIDLNVNDCSMSCKRMMNLP